MLNRLIVVPSKTMTQVPCGRSEGLVLVQAPPATMLTATKGAEFSLNVHTDARICCSDLRAKQRRRSQMTAIFVVKEIP